jgi:carboxyl-terminal processing protease
MKIKKIIAVVGIFILVLLAGIFIGSKTNIVSGAINNSNLNVPIDLSAENIDMKEFWDVWRVIEARHPDGTSVSSEEKVWGAIKGLVDSLDDPYTVFLPPKENNDLNIDLKGKFSGVGMEVGVKDGILTVISPLKDSPAEKAGIKSGDIILKINDKATTDLDIEEAVNLIRGKEGTDVTITIARKDLPQTKDITITRQVINIPVIDSEYLSKDKVFLIRFFQFGEDSSQEFEKALKDFKASGTKDLIIDLRDNPGGYLSAAVDISSWFLPEGETIVTEKSKDGSDDNVYKSSLHHLEGDYHVVLLVNGGSASASEIMAGALQEHHIAKLVGEQTFGKGSVQELMPMQDKTALKVTVANWYTPDGVSISKQGLKPDYVVKFDEDAFEKNGTDNQLQKAIEVIKKEK